MNNSTYKITLKEKFLLFLERTLDNLLKVEAFQRYVNRKANNKYGLTIIHGSTSEIDDVFKDYHFNDIQKTDIVLDIGAHVGGFSLFVSKFTKHVYAVEPMLCEKLSKNIEINNIKNISVLNRALGKGTLKISWTDCEDRVIEGLRLWQIIELCDGKIDVLKLDCEGGEWCIEPWELKGIRRIEAEVHNLGNTRLVIDFLKMLDGAKLEYTYTSPREGIMIVHAKSKIL